MQRRTGKIKLHMLKPFYVSNFLASAASASALPASGDVFKKPGC